MNWFRTVYKWTGLVYEPSFLKNFKLTRQNLTVDLQNFWWSKPVFNNSELVTVPSRFINNFTLIPSQFSRETV